MAGCLLASRIQRLGKLETHRNLITLPVIFTGRKFTFQRGDRCHFVRLTYVTWGKGGKHLKYIHYNEY